MDGRAGMMVGLDTRDDERKLGRTGLGWIGSRDRMRDGSLVDVRDRDGGRGWNGERGMDGWMKIVKLGWKGGRMIG